MTNRFVIYSVHLLFSYILLRCPLNFVILLQKETNLFSPCHNHHPTIVILPKYPFDIGCQNGARESERDRDRDREIERERALYLMVLPQSCWVRDLAWNRDIWPACLCCWDDAWTQLWRWTTAWRSVLNSRGPAVLQTCHPPARSKSHLEGDTCYSQSYYRHAGRIWIFHILELVSIIQITPTCRLN